MKIFAIICLIAIIIAFQHLLNWAIRSIWEELGENDTGGALFVSAVVSVIVGVITYFTGKYLIIWCSQLMLEKGILILQ